MNGSLLAHPDDATLIWRGSFVHRVHATATSRHASHSMRLCVALEGRLDYGDRPGHRDGTARACLVAPHTPHWIGSDGLCVALFVEPDRGDRMLGASGGITPLDDRLADELRRFVRDLDLSAPHGRAALDAWADEALARASHRLDLRDEPLDPRLAVVRRHLLASERHLVPADELAAAVGLSTSRLNVLMRRQIGWPLRRYARWHRLMAGVVAAASGERGLTHAALSAGFADHAHFTRTAREMLGQPPSMVPANVHVVSGYHG